MTDGGGIFVALTSCRDEERVEEFMTWPYWVLLTHYVRQRFSALDTTAGGEQTDGMPGEERWAPEHG